MLHCIAELRDVRGAWERPSRVGMEGTKPALSSDRETWGRSGVAALPGCCVVWGKGWGSGSRLVWNRWVGESQVQTGFERKEIAAESIWFY